MSTTTSADHADDIPLADFFRKVYEPQCLLGCKLFSRQSYGIAIRLFSRHLKYESKLSDLTDEAVAAFVAVLLESGRSVATVNIHFKKLKTLARYAWEKDLRPQPLKLRAVKQPKRIPRAWTLPEMEQLLKACSEWPGTVAGIQACDYWPALVLTLFDTGLRIKAMLGVEWTDLDMQQRTLYVRAEIQKQFAEQLLSISPDAVKLIGRIRQPDRNLIFPWLKHNITFYRHFDRILKAAGLPSDYRSKFHRIRRTTASHLAAAGGNPTEQLGHSSEAITKGYLDPKITRNGKQAVDLLPRPRLPK